MKKFITVGMIGATLLSGGLTVDISQAEAYMITCQEERDVGVNSYNDYMKKYKHYKDGDLSAFYRYVVETNPDKLNFNDGIHKRWVADDVLVVDNNELNAYMYLGGFMAFTKDELEFCQTYGNDGYTNTNYQCGWNSAYNGLYAGGRLLGIMCHEFGHYINEDYLKKIDKNMKLGVLGQIIGAFTPGTQNSAFAQLTAAYTVQSMVQNGYSKPDERDADETAMKLMSNMLCYGVGDICAQRYRAGNLDILNGEDPWKESETHPASYGRMQKAMDYIHKISDGKVTLRHYTAKEKAQYGRYNKMNEADSKHEYVLEVNGKLFNEELTAYPAGYAMGNSVGLPQDRTFHIAGQMASAIKKGVFKKANMRYITTSDMHEGKDGSTSTGYLYVSAPNKKGGVDEVVIDRVNVDKETCMKAVVSGPDCTRAENMTRYNEMAVIKGIYDAAL